MHNADEFLTYIANNEARLKRNLRKNITYDDYLFEEAFQNAIIKVYNSIVKNDRHIDDFERYFFIASKFEYILLDNRKKKERNISVDVEDAKYIADDDAPEDYNDEVAIIVNQLRDYLEASYGKTNAKMFIDYFDGKSRGEVSYRSIGKKYGQSIKTVAKIISAISEDDGLKNFYKAYQSLTDNV